jgi:hypothetical protein
MLLFSFFFTGWRAGNAAKHAHRRALIRETRIEDSSAPLKRQQQSRCARRYKDGARFCRLYHSTQNRSNEKTEGEEDGREGKKKSNKQKKTRA